MPRFRFSIRDLLWLVLVVAVAIGWLAREQRLGGEMQRIQAEADNASQRAAKWRMATGALEHVLRNDHQCRVAWDFAASKATVTQLTRYSVHPSTIDLSSHEPSALED